MESFVFIKQKDSKVSLPLCYDRDEKSIPGIYTTSSIRFYKKRLDDVINNIIFKHEDLKSGEIRNILRYFYSCMANFTIEDNKILLKGLGTVQERNYNFRSGLFIVKNENFMDIVEKKKIGEYLDKYGFDESEEEEIINNNYSIISRVPNKELKFTFI